MEIVLNKKEALFLRDFFEKDVLDQILTQDEEFEDLIQDDFDSEKNIIEDIVSQLQGNLENGVTLSLDRKSAIIFKNWMVFYINTMQDYRDREEDVEEIITVRAEEGLCQKVENKIIHALSADRQNDYTRKKYVGRSVARYDSN